MREKIEKAATRAAFFDVKRTSVLLVTDVLFLGGIEGKVADGSNQTVDTQSHHGQKQVATGSGGVALGLQGSVIDDQTTDPTQKEGQKKACDVVVHKHVLLSLEYIHYSMTISVCQYLVNIIVMDYFVIKHYMAGLGFVEIAQMQNVSNTTVWRRRKSIQKKYLRYVVMQG